MNFIQELPLLLTRAVFPILLCASLTSCDHHKMRVGRGDHAAILLPDCTVLVAGGYSRLSYDTFTSECFDPVKQTWSKCANLHFDAGHPTFCVAAGKYFLIYRPDAYQDGTPTERMERYDVSHKSWELLPENPPASDSTIVTLNDGRLLSIGGLSEGRGVIAWCFLFDVNTCHWTWAPPMSSVRMFCSAIVLPDGRVLAVGGDHGGGPPEKWLASCELFDPITGTWSAAADKLYTKDEKIFFHKEGPIELLKNGDVLAICNERCEIYNPKTDRWKPAARLAVNDEYVTVMLKSGRILAIGDSGNCEIYDQDLDTWTQTGSVIEPGRDFRATLLCNGKVLLTGGLETEDASDRSELYDPEDEAWEVIGD